MKLINRIGIAVVIFSSLAITVPTAIAHHSGVEFDSTKVVELNGTMILADHGLSNSWSAR